MCGQRQPQHVTLLDRGRCISMMDPAHAGQTQRPAGVILRDGAGTYYAISGAALARFQIPTDDQAAVEAFLKGEEPLTLPRVEGERSASPVRTSRRSDEL